MQCHAQVKFSSYQADKSHWGDLDHMSNGDIDSDDEDAIAERNEQQNLRQREVFLSRQVETLPATLIRGKCSVTLMSEVETAPSYLKRDDAFFYLLVYDPQQKTLQADRGEIRIGSSYQAHVQPLLKEGESDERGPAEQDGAGIHLTLDLTLNLLPWPVFQLLNSVQTSFLIRAC